MQARKQRSEFAPPTQARKCAGKLPRKQAFKASSMQARERALIMQLKQAGKAKKSAASKEASADKITRS